MEAYPPEYIRHDLPLVLLSGLPDKSQAPTARRENGARIVTESSECQSEQAQRLLREFLALDGSRSAWNSTALPGPSGTLKWRMKTIGRSYTLPARKAAPTAQTASLEGGPAAPPRSTELHSTLSPLSPGSPLFPDGLFTPAWFTKHQDQVPALLLSCFDLDPAGSAHDEQIKSDINATRTALTRSGYKSRFAAILLSQKSILEVPDLEDRIASIRRATGLQIFFVPPMSSTSEIATFVQGVMTTLQPSCIEYYRELTKHARRKKARGGPPPQSLQSLGAAVLSASAWSVRYEMKQGVFDEFAQSMDSAERHYSAAIEDLFSPEGGVFETTPSWSPRWDEARLLCDALALRVVRCQLWTGQTTGAVESWVNYKERMRDLIDRRGKGSNTYGWSAWEGRWAEIMAQVVVLAEVPSLRTGVADAVVQIYAPPEKPLGPTDRLPPFNFLHHSGYWLRLLTNSIRTRWTRALAIPEEDRIPPGQSPASAVANRFATYDQYLVPEPHLEFPTGEKGLYSHHAELDKATIRAVEAFEARWQMRMSEWLRFCLAENYAHAEMYEDALPILIQLWESSSWREDEWMGLFERLVKLLNDCVRKEKSRKHASLVPVLMWELLALHHDTDLMVELYDLVHCLDGWDVQAPVVLNLEDKQRLCPIVASFVFEQMESNVGELIRAQLTLTCNAALAGSLQMSRVELLMDSPSKLIVRHETGEGETDNSTARLLSIAPLKESADGNMVGTADLTLHSAQQKTFDVSFTLREAQTLNITELTIVIETETFILSHQLRDESIHLASQWRTLKDGKIESVLVPHMDTKSINVLPKPPKMKILPHGMRKQYFTDEQIQLPIELVNNESEIVGGGITANVTAPEGEMIALSWGPGERGESVVHLFDVLNPSASDQVDLHIDSPPEATSCTLVLEIQYTLHSDTSTILSKTATFELEFVNPFSATFTFAPRLHRSPWPSYFSPASIGTAESPSGIPQLWSLGAQISSHIDHALQIAKLELRVDEIHGETSCHISEASITKSQDLPPQSRLESGFELTTQKYSLDDRRATGLDLSLIITWSNSPDSSDNSTVIAVPRLNIPTSEPRVLCDVADYEAETGVATLQYHIENPSTHFLTFALTMEASDQFAFSGLKFRTLSLAPLSRHCAEYRVVLHEDVGDGTWIKPGLQVLDSYYQKNLRVNPGGGRVKLDASREVMVWVGNGEPD